MLMNSSSLQEGDEKSRLLSKLADADEVQGVDGAQELSVYNILDAPGVDETIRSNSGATPQFAVSVEFRKKSSGFVPGTSSSESIQASAPVASMSVLSSARWSR